MPIGHSEQTDTGAKPTPTRRETGDEDEEAGGGEEEEEEGGEAAFLRLLVGAEEEEEKENEGEFAAVVSSLVSFEVFLRFFVSCFSFALFFFKQNAD